MIDLLAMTSDNAGGHIAHIGGALFGMWFASRIRNGKDLTAPMNRLIDWFVNLGKRKPKMRVTYKRNETDYEYNARKHQESVDLDTILDKLKTFPVMRAFPLKRKSDFSTPVRNNRYL